MHTWLKWSSHDFFETFKLPRRKTLSKTEKATWSNDPELEIWSYQWCMDRVQWRHSDLVNSKITQTFWLQSKHFGACLSSQTPFWVGSITSGRALVRWESKVGSNARPNWTDHKRCVTLPKSVNMYLGNRGEIFVLIVSNCESASSSFHCNWLFRLRKDIGKKMSGFTTNQDCFLTPVTTLLYHKLLILTHWHKLFP